jgi:hypothetical protein
MAMNPDYVILTAVAILGIGGSLCLLASAKKYRSRKSRLPPGYESDDGPLPDEFVAWLSKRLREKAAAEQQTCVKEIAFLTIVSVGGRRIVRRGKFPVRGCRAPVQMIVQVKSL